jgi:hypothetical protein
MLNVNWRKTGALTLLIAAVTAIVLLAPLAQHWLAERQRERAEAPNPVLASDRQQLELLRVLLRDNPFEGVPPPPPEPGEIWVETPPPPIVLVDSTVALCPLPPHGSPLTACSSKPDADSLLNMEFDAMIPRKLREELLAANQSSIRLQDPGVARVHLASRATVADLLAGLGWWRDFYRVFPGSGGVIEVSRAVLNQDGTRALIYVSHRCDGTCGSGTLHYFQHVDGEWRVLTVVALWMS